MIAGIGEVVVIILGNAFDIIAFSGQILHLEAFLS
jgi:hypothetical protein